MKEISEESHAKIRALCEQGDEYSSDGNYSEALGKYWAAFDLVPETKEDYEAATWILTAIGDANFMAGDFESGRDNLTNVMHCKGAIGNPFIHLRLG